MKLVTKKYINEHERVITILGLDIKYSRTFDANNKVKYCIILGNKTFTFYKNIHKKKNKKRNLCHFDDVKLEYALVYTKCLRSVLEKSDTAETLILGSSTARCSFIEDVKSINLSMDAQDLYYSAQLFSKYKYQIPNLKNVVLYYDVFSPGNDLDISPSHNYLTAYYKVFFDIPYKNKFYFIKNDLIKLENKIYSLRNYINKNIDNVPRDIMPIMRGGMQSDEDMRNQALGEIKLANKGNMDKYLNLFLQEAKGLNIYIVLAPRHPATFDIYPSEEILFKNLYEMVHKQNDSNIKIINCFRNIAADGFVDLLHLSLNGAKNITEIINENISCNRDKN